MLTYDHDGNYNSAIISENNDDGDHFQGRRQHHHQHHHQHNHFSAFTSSPTTDVSSLPTIASSSIKPSSMPAAANLSSYDAPSSSYDATSRIGRVFSACLSIVSCACPSQQLLLLRLLVTWMQLLSSVISTLTVLV